MKESFIRKLQRAVLGFAIIVVTSFTAFASATITIQNNDPAGTGFNDATPVAPVGGNTGTTLGEQRFIAAQFAANLWGSTINSVPTIVIRASWSTSMPCTATTATLASAGTVAITREFPNGIPNTWYSRALANALAGSDLSPSGPEINAIFNARLGTTTCLENRGWYLGLDNSHGINIDLVTVLLHEFAHGLGFQSFTDETDGTLPSGLPGIYDKFLRDNSTGKTWDQMTDAERMASAINTGNVVWSGPNVINDVPRVNTTFVGTDGAGRPLIFAPNPVDEGSSISHWDRSLFPNQLMEPNISGDLTHNVVPPFDLTFSLFRDLGWTGQTTSSNPIDDTNFFVRQHYLDFLNREPDAGGLAFWTGEITSCGANAACIEVKRINVSAAFFLSIEFQETGYLVYRTYKTAFGNLTTPVAPVPVRFTDFLRDSQRIGEGVQVGIGDWQAQLEANKQAYIQAYVQRGDFLAAYPNNLSAAQFVDQMNANAGGVLSTAERNSLIASLTVPSSLAQRAAVLRAIAEDQTLRDAEKNKAFVLMQYFGYLRRNPDDVGFDGNPDPNFNGFNFWLAKLNQFNGNFIQAEMVKAFISSIEYRQRFGQ